jgi:hypothetical protein
VLRFKTGVLPASLAAGLALAADTVAGAPVKLWGETGVPVMTGPGSQIDAVAAPDGAGGAIVAWTDDRRSSTVTDLYVQDLYVQRLDGAGVRQWGGSEGLLIAPATFESGQWFDVDSPAIVADGSGGAIVAWHDRRAFQADVYVQRIASNGTILWETGGVAVAKACWPGGSCANHKRDVQIASDGAQGAIVTWEELRDGVTGSVWAQRVRADGSIAWQTDGVPVSVGSTPANTPKIASDGAGGAIIAWQRSGAWALHAQRIGAAGTALWPANGVPVAESAGGTDGYQIIADGSGGAIVAWVDKRIVGGNDDNIYAQRLNSAGASLWLAGGRPVCTRTQHQFAPTLASDGAGGAIIAWEDQGAGPSSPVAQRVDGAGVARWATDGVLVSPTLGVSVDVVADGAGGAYVAWGSADADGPSHLIQHLDEDGGLWAGTVELFQLAPLHYISSPRLVTDGAGGAIAYWPDYRFTGGTTQDFFANRISDQPVPPAPTPADLSVTLSAAPPAPYATGQVTYTATVSNGGPHTATLVAFNTESPLGSVLFSAATTQGTCVADGTISCNLGALGPGATATVAFVVTASGSGPLTAISYVAGNEPDPAPGDNRAELEVIVGPAPPDPIFSDGFESGDMAAWSRVESGGGDLQISEAAALRSSALGLLANVNDTAPLHVEDHSPQDESAYIARFHFDTNGFDPGEAEGRFRVRLLIVLQENPTRRVAAVVLRRLAGAYSVMTRTRLDDGAWADTGFFPISDGPHSVEIIWTRATAAGRDDGLLRFFVDGTEQATLTSLLNSASDVDLVRMGAMAVKPGASGTLFVDEFESRRDTDIGP